MSAHSPTVRELLELHITEHAFLRARERLGLSRKATERMALRAFEAGLVHADTAGGLRLYLDVVFHSHGKADNLRVHGEAIWVFCGQALLTVLHLPREFRATAHATRRARHSVPEKEVRP